MMNRHITGTGLARLMIAVIALFGVVVSVGAQRQGETCPPVVEVALSQTSTLCGATGRNEICYGFDTVRAEPNEALATPGDITSINRVQSVMLAGLDATVGQWGMALARLQVNLPDTLPGENVTFLIYGDATFEPIERDDAAQTPISAFRLRTGISGLTCGATPMTGLLVQTPDAVDSGSYKASFTLNGVEIRMGSTIALTADAEQGLNLSVLEGAAVVRARGRRGVALAGSRLNVPLDRDLLPADVPGLPVPYERDELEALPVLALDRRIRIADPVDEETLAELLRLLESDEDLDEWLDSDTYRRLLPALPEDGDEADAAGDPHDSSAVRPPAPPRVLPPPPPPAAGGGDDGDDGDDGDGD
jgi:hypothetical protein